MPELKRALVVDDNVDVLGGLEELLRLWGYDVSLAEDATGAWEVARHRRPDVVILDGNALDVIGRVKAADARVLVVVFSGWAHLEEAARAAGADAFVLKPDYDRLQRVLDGREA